MQTSKASCGLNRQLDVQTYRFTQVRYVSLVPYSTRAGVTAAAAAVVSGATAAAACCTVRCRTASGDTSSTADQQPAAAALSQQPAAAADSSSPFSFSEPQLRQLWDGVTRSLLKLGKSGLSDTHVNSLRELLQAHKLVKVQLNGATDEEVQAAAADMAGRIPGVGTVLQVKGKTILFASSTSSSEELLARAEASTASTAVWKAKRQFKKAEAAEKREEKAARKQGRS